MAPQFRVVEICEILQTKYAFHPDLSNVLWSTPSISWVVTTRNLIEVQCFDGIYRCYLQGRSLSQTGRTRQAAEHGSENQTWHGAKRNSELSNEGAETDDRFASCCLLLSYMALYLNLKMQVTRFPQLHGVTSRDAALLIVFPVFVPISWTPHVQSRLSVWRRDCCL
jgi:hypothetical protein